MFCLQCQWIEGDWNDACVATMVWQSMIVSYAKYRQCYEDFLRHMEHSVYVKYGRESLRVSIQMVFGHSLSGHSLNGQWSLAIGNICRIGYLKNGSFRSARNGQQMSLVPRQPRLRGTWCFFDLTDLPL